MRYHGIVDRDTLHPDRETVMAEAIAHETECTDVTARRAHQFGVVGLSVLGIAFAWIAPEMPTGGILLLAAGVIMGVGRFWAGADIFRQFVWRVAEPRGWVPVSSCAVAIPMATSSIRRHWSASVLRAVGQTGLPGGPGEGQVLGKNGQS
ncbi:MAG: hypothetical protein EB145_06515 [Proteobacteria bacterium]|nr:hypothetical protein [Pseudomonadota bacterium]